MALSARIFSGRCLPERCLRRGYLGQDESGRRAGISKAYTGAGIRYMRPDHGPMIPGRRAGRPGRKGE